MKDKGPFRGREALRIKGLHRDKTCKLSIANTELRNGDESGFDDMIANPEDKFCIVRLHKEVVGRFKLVDPAFEGRIFRRSVKKKSKPTNKPNMTKNGVLGHNMFSIITKSIARRTGMINPERCTPAARRRAGVTKLANKANCIPEALRMRVARHKCPSTHAKYQEINEDQMGGRYKAFFILILTTVCSTRVYVKFLFILTQFLFSKPIVLKGNLGTKK